MSSNTLLQGFLIDFQKNPFIEHFPGAHGA